MARISKEELLKEITDYIGDDVSDIALKLIEDATDSVDVSTNEEEWRTKLENLDNEWRARYKNRFLSNDKKIIEDEGTPNSDKDEVHEDIKIEDLFKEE